MAEPDFVHHPWTAESSLADAGHGLDASPRSSGEQLTLHLEMQRPLTIAQSEPPKPDIAPALPNFLEQRREQKTAGQDGHRATHEALLTELLHLRSLTQGQIERIHNLEQALDQSLTSVRELRRQVAVQEFLETQLASTEEISNVQQQAIARLKLQLAQQQADLAAQLNETQVRDRALQDLLSTLESLTEAQQTELERLRQQIAHDRGSVQSHQARLENRLVQLQATFSAQQQRIAELEAVASSEPELPASLSNWLDEVQTTLATLAAQAGAQQPTVQRLEAGLQKIRTALQTQSPPPVLDALPPLDPDFAIAQGKIEELETQIAKQLTTEAMLQQACQELEAERDRQQSRLAELERQTADMQEQILRQAQQASEYETAVQHWKDRYGQNCHQIQQLKDTLDRTLPQPPPEVVVLLATLQTPPLSAEPSSPASLTHPTPNQGAHIDLPDFLLRRRNKTRRS